MLEAFDTEPGNCRHGPVPPGLCPAPDLPSHIDIQEECALRPPKMCGRRELSSQQAETSKRWSSASERGPALRNACDDSSNGRARNSYVTSRIRLSPDTSIIRRFTSYCTATRTITQRRHAHSVPSIDCRPVNHGLRCSSLASCTFELSTSFPGQSKTRGQIQADQEKAWSSACISVRACVARE